MILDCFYFGFFVRCVYGKGVFSVAFFIFTHRHSLVIPTLTTVLYWIELGKPQGTSRTGGFFFRELA